jgi:hypothetical protein
MTVRLPVASHPPLIKYKELVTPHLVLRRALNVTFESVYGETQSTVKREIHIEFALTR